MRYTWGLSVKYTGDIDVEIGVSINYNGDAPILHSQIFHRIDLRYLILSCNFSNLSIREVTRVLKNFSWSNKYLKLVLQSALNFHLELNRLSNLQATATQQHPVLRIRIFILLSHKLFTTKFSEGDYLVTPFVNKIWQKMAWSSMDEYREPKLKHSSSWWKQTTLSEHLFS